MFRCPKDHGAWIEKKQLAPTFTQQVSPKHVPGMATSLNHRYSPAHPKTKLEIYYFDGIEIDVCPCSKGIWLDKEEILPVLLQLTKNDEKYSSLKVQDELSTWDWIEIVLNLTEVLFCFIR